jgi:hypothetical protein
VVIVPPVGSAETISIIPFELSVPSELRTFTSIESPAV